MFTKTNDCRAIGTIRHSNKEENLIPSVQFPFRANGIDSELMVVAFDIAGEQTRFVLELLYLASVGVIDDVQLLDILNTRVVVPSESVELFVELTSMRPVEKPEEISLNLSKDTLEEILSCLEKKGNLSFVVGTKLEHATTVDSLSVIDYKILNELSNEKVNFYMSRISKPHESLGLTTEFIYPEDWFINSGHRYLSYLDSMSGGEYYQYRTLKQVYTEDKYFSENPDLFNQTHCGCGSELVIRMKQGEYTLMSCVNHYCYEKYAFVLADFAQKLGIVGLGPGKFNDMCRNIALDRITKYGDGTVNFRTLLKPENEVYFGIMGKDLWFDFLDAIKYYNGTLSDLIELMSLPYIASNAAKVLTADLLKSDTLSPDILLQQSKSAGKRDIKFVLSLWLYMEDIKYVALELVDNLNLELAEELPIYITESIELELNDGKKEKFKKNEFIEFVNRAIADSGNTTTRIKLKKSLTRDCIALIADKSRNTGSCGKALSYGVPIVTSREFLLNLGGGGITK